VHPKLFFDGSIVSRSKVVEVASVRFVVELQ